MSSLGSLRSTIELHPQMRRRIVRTTNRFGNVLFLTIQRERDSPFFVPHVDSAVVAPPEVGRAVAVDAEAVQEVGGGPRLGRPFAGLEQTLTTPSSQAVMRVASLASQAIRRRSGGR